MVGVQDWNVPDSIPVSPRGAEILSAEVASRSPCRMPSDVDVETDLKRIFGGRWNGPKMSFQITFYQGPVGSAQRLNNKESNDDQQLN